ncbi:MAG: prolyl oligopeptidase family serine peptidase, partial [Cyanobacteriota bacterium]|nr:prolyl oligopeptidase family serine peptidase [Cyanobacteriota bacterium]
QMVQRGWAGAGQVGVTGCSYGGYYSAQLISRFPRLVAAANPQCSLLDTLTEWQLGYGALLAYLVGQTPMEAPQRYQRDSPLYQATAIRTPTLLFHGAEDFLQLAVVRNFHDAIAAAGVPVTLYEFEGLGHSLIDPEFQYLAAQLQVAFFRQYLQPTSALPPVAPRAGSGG